MYNYHFKIKAADVVFFSEPTYGSKSDIIYGYPLAPQYKSCVINMFLEDDDKNVSVYSLSDKYREFIDIDDKLFYNLKNNNFTYIKDTEEDIELDIVVHDDKSLVATTYIETLGKVTLFEFDKDCHLEFNGSVFDELFHRAHIATDNDRTNNSGKRVYVEDVYPALKQLYLGQQKEIDKSDVVPHFYTPDDDDFFNTDNIQKDYIDEFIEDVNREREDFFYDKYGDDPLY